MAFLGCLRSWRKLSKRERLDIGRYSPSRKSNSAGKETEAQPQDEHKSNQRMPFLGSVKHGRKIHKRVRFDVNPLFDRDNDTPDDEFIKNKYIHESEVLEEDPMDSTKEFSDPLILTEKDFWEYVYSKVWNGRLRVREGNLQRTLIRTFDELVVNRKIGWTETTRYYQAIQLRGRNKNTVFVGKASSNNKPRVKRKKRRKVKMENYGHAAIQSSSHTKYGAIKVVLTYYGGEPLGRRQKVSFDTRASVDTSPRLMRPQPILKGSRLRMRRKAIVDEEKEREMIEQTLSAKNLQFFVPRTPADFQARCARAANDFVVIKEQILNSRDWKIRTSITIARKVTSRFGLSRLSDALPRFYEDKTMIIC